MKRIVRVVEQNGTTHEVPMTAEQVAFYLRLAEMKSQADSVVTFCDVVAETQKQEDKARYN